MPYEIEYKDDEEIIITTFYGEVTDEDLLNSLDERSRSKDRIKSCKFSLNDFTDTTDFKVTSLGIERNARISIEISKINKQIKPILIAPTDLEFGMLRMWQAYSHETNWDSNVVRTYDEAILCMKECQ